MSTPITPTGILVPRIEVGDPEWLRVMSASKIAAVVGLSPWESPFSLYHRMTGQVSDNGNDATRRGHYLEPAIAAWFADQHPDRIVETTGTWIHHQRPTQAATPDRLVTDQDGNVELLECKSSAIAEDWGAAGTDEIPVYYRGQVIWQLDTLGLKRCHVAVLLPFLEFRSFVVDYDADEAKFMRDRAEQFLADVAARNRPAIDDSAVTYQVVRELHPDIDGDDAEVTPDLAFGYRDACTRFDEVKAEKQGLTSQLLDAMGTARYARCEGQRVAMRVPGRGTNPPFLRPCKADTNRSAA